MYYPQAPFGSGVNKNLAKRSLDFSFMRILALFFINVKTFTKMTKTSY